MFTIPISFLITYSCAYYLANLVDCNENLFLPLSPIIDNANEFKQPIPITQDELEGDQIITSSENELKSFSDNLINDEVGPFQEDQGTSNCLVCPEYTEEISVDLFNRDHYKETGHIKVSRYHAMIGDQVVIQCRIPNPFILSADKMWADSDHLERSDDAEGTLTMDQALTCPEPGGCGQKIVITKTSVAAESDDDDDDDDKDAYDDDVDDDNDEDISDDYQMQNRKNLWKRDFAGPENPDQDLDTSNVVIALDDQHFSSQGVFVQNRWVNRFDSWSTAILKEGQDGALNLGLKVNSTIEHGGLYQCSFYCYHGTNIGNPENLQSFSASPKDKCLCQHIGEQSVELVVHETLQEPAKFKIYVHNIETWEDPRDQEGDEQKIIFDAAKGSTKIGCEIGQVFPEIRIFLYANWTKTGKSVVLLDESYQDLRWTADTSFMSTTDINLDQGYDNAKITCEYRYLYYETPRDINNKISADLVMMSSPRTIEVKANKDPVEKGDDFLIYDMSPGEIIQFECRGNSSPPPYFEWIKNGSLLQIGPILSISNFALVKRSVIACVARNKLGSIMSKRITVMFKPINGNLSDAASYKGNLLTLKWRMGQEDMPYSKRMTTTAMELRKNLAQDSLYSKDEEDIEKLLKKKKTKVDVESILKSYKQGKIKRWGSLKAGISAPIKPFSVSCNHDSDCTLQSESARCQTGRCVCLTGEIMTRKTRCSKRAYRNSNNDNIGNRLATNGPFIIGVVILSIFAILGVSVGMAQIFKRRKPNTRVIKKDPIPASSCLSLGKLGGIKSIIAPNARDDGSLKGSGSTRSGITLAPPIPTNKKQSLLKEVTPLASGKIRRFPSTSNIKPTR